VILIINRAVFLQISRRTVTIFSIFSQNIDPLFSTHCNMNGTAQKTLRIKTSHFSLVKRSETLVLRLIFRFFQKLLLVAGYFIGYILADFKIEGKEIARNIKNGPLLIIANHKSYLDPLLMGTGLPFFSKLYPLRFMAKDCFFKSPIRKLIFRAIGSFPSYAGQGLDKSLKKPAKLLKHNKTVVFFPEGICIRDESLGKARRGVGVLARQFPDIPILPIAITGSQNVVPALLRFRRARVRVKIGKPFRYSDLEINGNDAAIQLMKQVEKVYNQIV
jgi:1-acyl-sn-glycerol-3-phosphate acyltransferase